MRWSHFSLHPFMFYSFIQFAGHEYQWVIFLKPDDTFCMSSGLKRYKEEVMGSSLTCFLLGPGTRKHVTRIWNTEVVQRVHADHQSSFSDFWGRRYKAGEASRTDESRWVSLLAGRRRNLPPTPCLSFLPLFLSPAKTLPLTAWQGRRSVFNVSRLF